jgi:hypothetical protein
MAFTLMQSLSKLMDAAVREDGIMAVFGAPIAFEDAPASVQRGPVKPDLN